MCRHRPEKIQDRPTRAQAQMQAQRRKDSGLASQSLGRRALPKQTDSGLASESLEGRGGEGRAGEGKGGEGEGGEGISGASWRRTRI